MKRKSNRRRVLLLTRSDRRDASRAVLPGDSHRISSSDQQSASRRSSTVHPVELLKALEPEYEEKEENIVKHDYRAAQAAAMEKLWETRTLQRLTARTGQTPILAELP